MTDLTPDQLLDRTADVIEKRGHTKFIREEKPGGPVCLVGAFGVAEVNNAWEWTESDVLQEATSALWHEIGEPVVKSDSSQAHRRQIHALVDWNNADERTLDEVIDNLRWAAKRLRGGA